MTSKSKACFVLLTLVVGSALGSGGCSGEDRDKVQAKTEPQHVWKDQTDMLTRARDVEKQVLSEAQRREAEIDAQAR